MQPTDHTGAPTAPDATGAVPTFDKYGPIKMMRAWPAERDDDSPPDATALTRALSMHDGVPDEHRPTDHEPLRNCLPGIWPTVGDLRALLAAPPPGAPPLDAAFGIYMASKAVHGSRWRDLRDAGWPIVSTWIDEAEAGRTADWADLWDRCASEPARAAVTIVYREDGEELKGARVEAGAALSHGRRVIVVGDVSDTWTKHRNVQRCATVEEALASFMAGAPSDAALGASAARRTSAEIAREQDAYAKGYAAAKALLTDAPAPAVGGAGLPPDLIVLSEAARQDVDIGDWCPPMPMATCAGQPPKTLGPSNGTITVSSLPSPETTYMRAALRFVRTLIDRARLAPHDPAPAASGRLIVPAAVLRDLLSAQDAVDRRDDPPSPDDPAQAAACEAYRQEGIDLHLALGLARNAAEQALFDAASGRPATEILGAAAPGTISRAPGRDFSVPAAGPGVREAAQAVETCLHDCTQWDPECPHARRALDRVNALATAADGGGAADGWSRAVLDIANERRRQVETGEWASHHDRGTSGGQVALAAAAYAERAHAGRKVNVHPPSVWPWALRWWQPNKPRRNLVEAGALIVAEIERLDRTNAGGRT